MADELKTLMAGIATVVGATTGIRVATSTPNETPPADPFAIIFELEGSAVVGTMGARKTLDNIAVDVLKQRKDLPRDIAALNSYLDSIPRAMIGEITEGGGKFGVPTFQTFSGVHKIFLPSIEYGGVQYIGYRFVMQDCKFLVNL
jgi:hypothetical protein